MVERVGQACLNHTHLAGLDNSTILLHLEDMQGNRDWYMERGGFSLLCCFQLNPSNSSHQGKMESLIGI